MMLALLLATRFAHASDLSISPPSLSIATAYGSGQVTASLQLTNSASFTITGQVAQTNADCSALDAVPWLSTASSIQVPR
jgi:hypothetical protein